MLTKTPLALELEHTQIANELELEFFSTIGKLLTDLKESISDRINKIFNEHVETVIEDPIYKKGLIKDIVAIGNHDLQNVRAYGPANLSTNLPHYLEEMSKIVRDLSDIEGRLYEPLTEFLAKASSDDEFMSKAWTDRNLKMRDVKDIKKTIKKIAGDTSDLKDDYLFSEVYPRVAHVEQTTKDLIKLTDEARTIRLDKIKQAEKRLMEVLEYFIEEKFTEVDSQLSKDNKKRLIQALLHIAEETELLAFVVYHVNTATVAHNATMEHFKENVLA